MIVSVPTDAIKVGMTIIVAGEQAVVEKIINAYDKRNVPKTLKNVLFPRYYSALTRTLFITDTFEPFTVPYGSAVDVLVKAVYQNDIDPTG